MVELLVAIVMLNIGILALMGVFSSGTVALRNSGYTSNGTVLADKALEVYRDLYSCAVYLTQTSLNAVPSNYYTDPNAYANVGQWGGTNSLWVTYPKTGTTAYADIPASDPTCQPSSPAITWMDPTKASQTVTGPDGKSYKLYAYIVIVHPTGPGGGSLTTGYVKQVTVEVFSPKNTSQILARETSIFEPNTAAKSS